MKTHLYLLGLFAASLYGAAAPELSNEENHFDSPADLLKWNKHWKPDQARPFYSANAAVGKGCIEIGGISKSFPKPVENGVVSFLMYNRNTETFSANPPATVTFECRREGTKKPSQFIFIFRGENGWGLRDPDRTESVCYPYTPNHTGWTRFDAVAENKRIRFYIDGVFITTLAPEYTALLRFHANQTPSPTRFDEYSFRTDPAEFRPNPVQRIVKYESIALKQGEKLKVDIPLERKGLHKDGVLELRLFTKQAKLVSSAKNAKGGKFELPAVPRSGRYTLETRYHVPGKHADMFRQNVDIQVVNPKWNNPGFAPIPLHKTPWAFLPVGNPEKKNFHDCRVPRAEDLRVPEAVPTDWRNAQSVIGPWNTGRWGICGRVWHSAWHRQSVRIPSAWSGMNVKLTVENPMTEVIVFADGKNCGKIEWPAGSVILPDAKPGRDLDLALYVIANPQYGYSKVADEVLKENLSAKRVIKLRGLCGKVLLSPEAKKERIADVAVSPSVTKRQLTLTFDLAGLVPGETYTLSGAVLDAGKEILPYTLPAFTAKNAAETKSVTVNWNAGIRLWEVAKPYLYDLTAKIEKPGFLRASSARMWPVRFGFREISAKGPKLLVNNRPITFFMTLYPPADSLDFYKMCETIHTFSPYAEFDPDYYDETGMVCLKAGTDISAGYRESIPALVRKSLIHSPEFWEKTEAITKKIIGMKRNHASILTLNGLAGGNASGQGSKYNPFFANGTWFNRQEGNALGIEINKNNKRALEVLRRLAPDQVITAQDSGSFNDTRHITEYAGFLPIQEIIEEGLWWNKIARKPLIISEQAAPFFANWTDACSHHGKGWSGVPCYQEWMAITEGDDAWPRGDFYNDMLKRLEKNVQKRHANLRKTIANATELRKALLRQRMNIDVTMIQANLNHTAHAKVTRDRMKENIFFLRAFGIGAMSFGFASEVDKYLVWQEYQRPVTGFLAGQKDRITDKTHIYAPGELLRRGVVLLNNSCDPASLSAEWELVLDGRKIKSGRGEKLISAGSVEFLPIEIALPDEAKDRSGTLTVRIMENGKPVRSDVCSIDILAPVKYTGTKPVALVDLERETVDKFLALGIPFRLKMFDEDFSGFDVIVFGRRAFNYENRLLSEGLDLRKLLEAGKKIIVLEQDEKVLRERFKFRTEYVSPRDMFGRTAGHPLLKGLPDRVLKNWRGAATLTSGFEAAANRTRIRDGGFRDGGTWLYEWNNGKLHHRPMKWGNTHNVSTVTVIKPDTGNFRTLIDCAYGSNYLAAFELMSGRGRMIFSQADVIGRTEDDPAANRYLVNLLNYANTLPANNWKKVVCVPDGKSEKILASLNIPFTTNPAASAPEKTICVVSGKSDEAVRLAKKGATVFVFPGRDYSWLPVPVATEKKTFNQTVIGKSADPLLAGLGSADFFWKGNVTLNTIRNARLTDTGVLERIPWGKGQFILCQIVPEFFGDVEIQHWMKPSKRITERMIRTLFTNLGAEMPDPKLVYPPFATTLFDRAIDFAGEWEVAKSASDQPPLDGWRKITLPGAPQAAYPEWKSNKGCFWYRRTFDIPDISGAERLNLLIGSVSGINHLYVNGSLAAFSDMQTNTNSVATIERDYEIDKSLFKPGRNTVTMRVQYDVDDALGNKGSTGAVHPPFKLSVFRSIVKNDIPAPMLLNSEYGWWGQPVASKTAPWNHRLRKRVAVPGIIQAYKHWAHHTGYFRYWYEFKMEKPLPAGLKPFLVIEAVDDEDTTFFNKKQIGHTGKDTNPHDYWMAKRVYPIPAELFRVGNNHIEMIHNDFNVSGGITGNVTIFFEDPAITLKRNLAEWPYLYNVGKEDDPYWHHGF